MKEAKALTGRVLLPLVIGERTSIVVGDKVTFTTSVEAIHEISKRLIVFETKNSVYTVTLLQPYKTGRLRSAIASMRNKAGIGKRFYS